MSFLDKARPVGSSTGVTPTTPTASATPSVSFASKARPKEVVPTEDPNKVKGGILGEIFTGNTQRFGKTIGSALAAPGNAKLFEDALENHTNMQTNLMKTIREKKQKGEDTSRLEGVLATHIKNTPQLEDFTGDVINKTTGQILGEAGGTALEILPFGTYGKATKGMKAGQLATKAPVAPTAVKATKDLLTKPGKFLTKEGGKQALEGAAFGYGVDVTQGLQEGEGAGAFKPGLGTAIGAVAPAAAKAVGVGVKAATKGVTGALEKRAAKIAGEADHLIGTIVQGESKDIPAARRAFSQIDTAEVKTYSDLKDALNEKIKTGSEKLREALGYEPYVKPLDELTITSKVGDIDVSRNFVDDAISQLDDFYTKTGNYEDAARMQALKQKAAREGITVQEINDLAIRHGQDLSGFSPATGELASGLKKQLAENTRKGLKQTARDQFKSKVYDETDAALSDLIKTRDLVSDMEEAVLKLEQKTRDATLGERAGALIEQVLNFVSFGTTRGFLQSGRDLGLFKMKTSMTSVELQERLAKNLKRLTEIIDSPPNQMEKKLDAFLKENKIPAVIPPKLNKKAPASKPLAKTPPKLGKNKGSSTVGAVASAALGLGAVTGLMTPSTTTYTAPERPPAPVVEKVKIPHDKLGNVLKQLESSGGVDKRSADPGEMKWLTGLTNVAIKELKRLGIKKSVNVASEADVLDASAKYFEHLQERNPDLTPAEVYADKYWTQWKNMKDPQAARQRAIDKFNNLIK